MSLLNGVDFHGNYGISKETLENNEKASKEFAENAGQALNSVFDSILEYPKKAIAAGAFAAKAGAELGQALSGKIGESAKDAVVTGAFAVKAGAELGQALSDKIGEYPKNAVFSGVAAGKAIVNFLFGSKEAE